MTVPFNPGPWRVPQPTKPSEPPVQVGWLCPACGAGNAPWSAQCGCQGRKEASTSDHTNVTITGAVRYKDAFGKCLYCKDTGHPFKYVTGPGVGMIQDTNKPCPAGCKPLQVRNEDTVTYGGETEVPRVQLYDVGPDEYDGR